MLKDIGFLSFARTFFNKYRKHILDTRLDALKTTSKKLVHKAVEATSEFIGNKTADKFCETKTCN